MAHRALHTTGGLSHEGQPTGVSFGLLRDLERLRELYAADRTVLAFDAPGSLREKIYPGYKLARRSREFTPEETKIREDFYVELDRLKNSLLSEAGFRNVFFSQGYEADDVIAHVCQNLPPETDAVIVSTDKDLWQCLNERVVVYNPLTKKVITAESFQEKWGISPALWVNVKALAGCDSDSIEGIRGVGDLTAARYCAGTLKPESAVVAKIRAGREIYERNLPLVRLPYPGLELPPVMVDEVTLGRLSAVRARLGIRGAPVVEPAYPGLEM